MDTANLLIVLVTVLVLGGSARYIRGHWFYALNAKGYSVYVICKSQEATQMPSHQFVHPLFAVFWARRRRTTRRISGERGSSPYSTLPDRSTREPSRWEGRLLRAIALEFDQCLGLTTFSNSDARRIDLNIRVAPYG